MESSLAVRMPFDVRHLFGFLLARAIPGVEAGDAQSENPWYARTLSLQHGPGAFKSTWEQGRLNVDFECESPQDLPEATLKIRRLFDLDADPVAVNAALGRQECFRETVALHSGIRVPGTVDASEIVVRAIVGQQISVAAARTHLTRLTQAVGRPITSRFPLTHLFPTPAQIADLLADLPTDASGLDSDRPLRLPLRALRTLRDTTAALAAGSLVVSGDPCDLISTLVARPGIGPWTASYIALRVLNHPDMWLPGDVGLIHGAHALGLLDPDLPRAAQHARLEETSASWAPWRSYAVMHLWHAAASARMRNSNEE